jgi:hypothetical protein
MFLAANKMTIINSFLYNLTVKKDIYLKKIHLEIIMFTS